MTQQREITGRFLRESFAFVSSDGATRTIIGEIETEHGTQKIKGEAAEGELCRGLVYRFYGHVANHWKHGPQFAFDSYVVDKPAGAEAVQVYLEQLDGIGPAKSAKLWTLYGEDAVRMVRESPLKVAEEIKWNADKATEAAAQLKTWERIEGAKLDLLAILHGRGLPKKTVEKAIEVYGSQAATIIRRNPYLLMQFRGCGFLKTDRLYIEFGHNPSRMKRQALCAWHALASNSDGDTWFHQNTARDALAQNVSGSRLDLPRALELSLRAGLLAEFNDSIGQRWIAERRKADSESRVADYIDLAEQESSESLCPWNVAADLSAAGISEHQAAELANATQSVIGVLAGSPGTGKTFTSAALIRLLIAAVGEKLVAVCAPTGKAAVRLTEALQKNRVSLKATTIHSLLAVQSNDDGWQFHYNARNPLPHSYVIIDESSMIDTDLMASLLSARGRGTCFLFVGDPNQLSPVGHGAPLRDLIAAGVPTGTLTEIQRNSGRIIRACAQIREGKRFDVSPAIDLDAAENLTVVQAATPETQIETLTSMMTQFRDTNPQKYDPIWDVQIIVAVNKKSPLGRKPLNAALQSLLNPHGETCQGSPFRVADKIINTKNGWFPAADPGPDKDGKFYVANGEQAEVLKVEPRRTIARLAAPDRLIVIPRGDTSRNESDTDDDSTGTGCNWELGYAISCHKSQGSEWPIVIVMLDEYPGARGVCSRQWIYTALSRAKIACYMVGKKSTADQMVNRDALFKRKTFLVEKINTLRDTKKRDQTPIFDLDAIFELMEA